MTRVVSCLRQISAKDAEVLDLEMCSSTRRPKSKMRCSEAPCPPRWEVDDWSEVGDVTYACVIWRIVCHFTLLFGRLLLLTFIYVVFPHAWSDLIIQEWARVFVSCVVWVFALFGRSDRMLIIKMIVHHVVWLIIHEGCVFVSSVVPRAARDSDRVTSSVSRPTTIGRYIICATLASCLPVTRSARRQSAPHQDGNLDHGGRWVTDMLHSFSTICLQVWSILSTKLTDYQRSPCCSGSNL